MYKRGTNQYKAKQRFPKRWKQLVQSLTIFTVALTGAYISTEWENNKGIKLLDPRAVTAYAMEERLPTSLVVDSPEKAQIISYVKEVFGTHADKAFLVLSCENSALNPKALNTAGNIPAGAADVGLFQINEYWQKVGNRAFLMDYKINTQIAWNIYSRNGYSFERWTCGRKHGV